MKNYLIKTTYTALKSNDYFKKGDTQEWLTGKHSPIFKRQDLYQVLLYAYNRKCDAIRVLNCMNRQDCIYDGFWKIEREVVEY